jgi:hypothetical protein
MKNNSDKNNEAAVQNCPACQTKISIEASKQINDDEIICDCGSLVFPSDFGLCKAGYKQIYMPFTFFDANEMPAELIPENA